MRTRLKLSIERQPDDTTCGQTCLQALYAYYGDSVPLEQVIDEVQPLETGGTLAVHLARHALARGYGATIYTYNLELFDPSWFANPATDLAARLRAQASVKRGRNLRSSTDAYLDFLERGGVLRFEELSGSLLRGPLEADHPLLCGLSATYLYGCPREFGRDELDYDDIRGHPVGHFVVLCGYDAGRSSVLVADPLQDNPRFGSHYYEVGIERVLGAILLGVMTYDANFLLLEPRP